MIVSDSYALAESLNLQLDDAGRNVGGIIQQVNALTAPPHTSSAGLGEELNQTGAGEEDAVAQIAAILNAHLGSLRWVDDTATSLRDRLAAFRRGHTDVTQPSWRR